MHAFVHTVEIVAMHNVIMHKCNNAWDFLVSRLGRQVFMHFWSYCIMHRVFTGDMHYDRLIADILASCLGDPKSSRRQRMRILST